MHWLKICHCCHPVFTAHLTPGVFNLILLACKLFAGIQNREVETDSSKEDRWFNLIRKCCTCIRSWKLQQNITSMFERCLVWRHWLMFSSLQMPIHWKWCTSPPTVCWRVLVHAITLNGYRWRFIRLLRNGRRWRYCRKEAAVKTNKEEYSTRFKWNHGQVQGNAADPPISSTCCGYTISDREGPFKVGAIITDVWSVVLSSLTQIQGRNVVIPSGNIYM